MLLNYYITKIANSDFKIKTSNSAIRVVALNNNYYRKVHSHKAINREYSGYC